MEIKKTIYTGNPVTLGKIIFFIHSKDWEITAAPVHTGEDNYEIDFIKEPIAPLAGTYYRGKFWIDNHIVKHKEIVIGMS